MENIEKELRKQALDNKLNNAFAYVKDDTLRQLEILIDKDQPIPPTLRIEFTLNLV
jgi:hypothetical protein